MLGITIALIASCMPQNKFFNWQETYDPESKEPYGAYIFSALLKEKNKGKNFHILTRESIKKYLEKNPAISNTTYIAMGHSVFMNDAENKSLAEFVKKGNTAFICLSYPPFKFLNLNDNLSCAIESYNNYITDTVADLTLLNHKLNTDTVFRYHFILRNKKSEGFWFFLDSSIFCHPHNNFTALGYLGNGYFNYLKMPYGKGSFYFHTTPAAFSNIAMLDKSHWQYFNKAISYLPFDNIIWDQYHGELVQHFGGSKNPGPLKYIMENLPLRWAWYLLLLGLLLFVIFFGKRRQKIIPVLPITENTSVEYAHTITELYFIQNNNKSIAQHRMRLFHSFIRSKYFFPSLHFTDDIIKKLSLKSGITEDHLRAIFATYQLMESRMEVTNGDLINFHNLIEHFYTHCK